MSAALAAAVNCGKFGKIDLDSPVFTVLYSSTSGTQEWILLRYLPVILRFLVRRAIVAGLVGASTLCLFGLAPAPSNAGIANFTDSTKEMVIGQADAPLTIVEYASLGCSHCASFHSNTYPQLKRDYIDPGKVKLVFRDFPLGTPALAATMIARCSGPQQYFGFVNIFFRAQQQWSRADNPLDALIKVARFGGMSSADVQACISNQKLLDHIQGLKQKAYEKDGVNATPYFVIGTEKLSGVLPYDEFKKILDRELIKVQ